MATALHPSLPENGPSTYSDYARGLSVTELDFKDNRYPAIPSLPGRRPSDRQSPDAIQDLTNVAEPQASKEAPPGIATMSSGWESAREKEREIQLVAEPDPIYMEQQYTGRQPSAQPSPQPSLSPRQSIPPKYENTSSYILPPGAARGVDRYSLDDTNVQRITSSPISGNPPAIYPSSQQWQQPPGSPNLGDRPPLVVPSSPRHPMTPQAGIGANGHSTTNISYAQGSGINIPISPQPRAYAQQPTYVTPPNAPNPMNTIPLPPQPPEEICLECTMRDQDMADVDATSPGVWERDSDVLYEDLLRRENEEEASGIAKTDPSRPRAKGGLLTEQNLKIWLSINPREPTSKHHNMEKYIKSQRMLLEAEALAHARAMQESRQLDGKMRDTYSQLRRSAYDLGASSAPIDDSGGVRIKPPGATTVGNRAHTRSHSREVTLLENGMIVEHVDVRKEEREERERRRKEERRERSRSRKASRGSAVDVTSVYSVQSVTPQTDSGLGVKYSPYSQTNSARPASVLTAPTPSRPNMPRAMSQASFSDVHSLGSPSPTRPRFFGFKNLSGGWRSQDSLAQSGMSGSVVDMHVALQREAYGSVHSPGGRRSMRMSQAWPQDGRRQAQPETITAEKPKKKKTGLAKIWQKVTGKNDGQTHTRDISKSNERHDDDFPLAPPPPLSHLVNRGSRDNRYASTPSLSSATSPKPNGMTSPLLSPTTAASSVLPSPASSPPSMDRETMNEKRKNSGDQQSGEFDDSTRTINSRNLYAMNSEPDFRRSLLAPHHAATMPPVPSMRPVSSYQAYREKSLPPLPGENPSRRPSTANSDNRPKAQLTQEFRQIPPGGTLPEEFQPPQAAFRQGDPRRQSFGGIATRPNLQVLTMPPNSAPYVVNGYDEFGRPRQLSAPMHHQMPPPTKRGSKFGFASLFGKNSSQDKPVVNVPQYDDFSSLQTSRTQDGRYEVTSNGHATTQSKHSTLGNGNMRMSVTSRKAIESLVAQDPEFKAYRYPSSDQTLDLLR